MVSVARLGLGRVFRGPLVNMRLAERIGATSIKRRVGVVLLLLIGLQFLVGAALLGGAAVTRAALVSLYQARLLSLQQLKTVNDGYALSVVEVAHKVRDGNMSAASGLTALEAARPGMERSWRAFIAADHDVADKAQLAALAEAKTHADEAMEQLTQILRNGGERDSLDFFVTGSLYSFIDPLFVSIADYSDHQLRAARVEIVTAADQLKLLLALSALFAAAGIASAVFGVGIMTQTVVKPLEELAGALDGDAMHRHVPGTARQDEIGKVARALDASLQRAADAARLEREAADAGAEAERLRDAERDRQAQRARQLDENLAVYHDEGTRLAKAVGAAAQRLRELSTQSASHARANMASAADAAIGSAQAAESVRSVAIASGRLARVVDSIRAQTLISNQLVGNAVSEAEGSSAQAAQLLSTVSMIRKAAADIGEIATQTNLLALNASIEASRAGTAGRGFAVVASEVKSLAGESGRVAEGIGSRLDEVNSASRLSAASLSNIASSIGEIERVSRIINDAVDEQATASVEIASSANQVAAGAEDVSRVVEDLRRHSADAERAAQQVMEIAIELAEQSVHMQMGMRDFFETVRTV